MVVRQIELLTAADLPAANTATILADLHQGGVPKYTAFASERIDLLPHAGLLDPARTQKPELRRQAETPSLLFPHGVGPGAAAIPRIRAGDTRQYDLFLSRGLATGKFLPVRHAKAGGGFFCIEKSSGDRLRAIWNGNDVSARTLAAPMPPELLTPECLGKMDFEATPKLSKRDGRVLFDQLRVPMELVRYLAGPPSTLRRLQKAGAEPEVLALLRRAGLRRDDRFFPLLSSMAHGFFVGQLGSPELHGCPPRWIQPACVYHAGPGLPLPAG